jgi:hypothetical protein
MRAGLYAGQATVAFLPVDGPDVAVLPVHVEGTGRTALKALGLETLPALLETHINREPLKRVLDYLKPGQREILSSFVSKRACEHTSHAALALLEIDEQVSFAGRELQLRKINVLCWRYGPLTCLLLRGLLVTAYRCHQVNRAGDLQEISPTHPLASVSYLAEFLSLHGAGPSSRNGIVNLLTIPREC